MDVDRDGSIDYTEFKLALNATGLGPSMALISHTQVEENIAALQTTQSLDEGYDSNRIDLTICRCET